MIWKLINERKSTGLKHFNDSKAFVDTYRNIEEYNPNKQRKILTVFGDIIADTHSNKKLNSVVTELFIKIRKLNISVGFIRQSYFIV